MMSKNSLAFGLSISIARARVAPRNNVYVLHRAIHRGAIARSQLLRNHKHGLSYIHVDIIINMANTLPIRTVI